MSAEQWFSIARDVVMLGVAALVFYWGQDRQSTVRALDSRFAQLDKRFDESSERSSKLASSVQGIIGRLDRMPEDLRETFVSHDSAELMVDKAIRERVAGLPPRG